MDRRRTWFERHRLDLALVALALAIVAPWVHRVTAQVSSRYVFSAAIVDQGTARLDDYTALLGIDRVEIDGHVYSDKAPGQPVLAVPAVALGQALGAEPATEPRFEANLGVWPATLVSAMIPFALLLVLMRRHARRFVPHGPALGAASALAFTTLLLPMGSELYSHVLAGVLALGAWHLLSAAAPTPARTVAAGALAGFAVAVEYPLLAVAGVLGLVLLVERRWGDAVRFGLAAAPFVIAVGIYHWVLLGDPTASPYTLKDGGRLHLLTLPGLDNTLDVFVGVRGFVFTPVVLLGLVALCWNGLWPDGARHDDARRERLVAATVVGGFLVLQIGWNDPWTGESPGPRLVTAALPFLVVPVGLALGRIPRSAGLALAGLGAVSMGLALVTLQLLPPGAGLISGHLENLRDDRFGLGDTVFTMALGSAGWAVHVGLVLAAAAWVWREHQRAAAAR